MTLQPYEDRLKPSTAPINNQSAVSHIDPGVAKVTAGAVWQDFREAVAAAVGDEGEPVLEEQRLREILSELPDVYTLHRRILEELENRLRHW